MKRFLFFLVFLIVFFSGMFAVDLKNFIIKNIYEDKYIELVFRCDQSMRLHFIAKKVLSNDPNEENANNLQQAELGLIDCQDYDLLRKKLLNFGLNETDLSELGLRGIEKKSKDIRKVVETHEIYYE